jgi:hypothetical protein
MRMRLPTFLITAVAGLALAPSAVADTLTGDLNLTRSACSGNTDVLGLSYDYGAYSGSCGSIPGISVVTRSYPSGALPAPVTLDTTRPIDIAIDLATQTGLPAFGDQTVGVELFGTTANGKTVSLGSDEEIKPAANMLTDGNYVQEFSLPLTAAKRGPFKGLSLDLSVGGSINGGYVGHGGKSLVSIPVFDDAILVPEEAE